MTQKKFKSGFKKVLKERINLRLTESKQIHRYYDKVVSLEEILIR